MHLINDPKILNDHDHDHDRDHHGAAGKKLHQISNIEIYGLRNFKLNLLLLYIIYDFF